MHTLANIEDPGQGLHCLLRQNDLQRKKNIFYLEITWVKVQNFPNPEL